MILKGKKAAYFPHDAARHAGCGAERGKTRYWIQTECVSTNLCTLSKKNNRIRAKITSDKIRNDRAIRDVRNLAQCRPPAKSSLSGIVAVATRDYGRNPRKRIAIAPGFVSRDFGETRARAVRSSCSPPCEIPHFIWRDSAAEVRSAPAVDDASRFQGRVIGARTS